MKATCQWDSAGTRCLSGMPILRAREVNAVFPKPPTPGHWSRKLPLRGDEHGASDMPWLQRIQDIRCRGEKWLNQFHMTSAITWLPSIPMSNS
jgi:hypothetical protein